MYGVIAVDKHVSYAVLMIGGLAFSFVMLYLTKLYCDYKYGPHEADDNK